MTDSSGTHRPHGKILLAALLTGSVMTSGPAAAETLQEALVKAYQNNPTLTGARAGQRANDENVPIQRSYGLPDVGVSANYNDNIFQSSSSSLGQPQRSLSANGQLSVPIYQGGAVRNSVKAAKLRVDAGQANLRATEASIFSQVVGAYMDVIRDQAIVQLSRNNVDVLRTNLEASSDRFEIGDLTRTDVAQSEARLALAEGELRGNEAQLIASREAYARLVGTPPQDLQPPPPLPNMPASVDEAVDVALNNNPDIASAALNIEASRADISTARAARLPKIAATISGSYTNYLNSLESNVPSVTLDQQNSSAVAGVSLNLPLFTAGRNSAQVRQAQSRSSQSLEQYIETERSVIAQTRGAYAAWQANSRIIAASQQAVSANALSLEGVRAENSVGNRTILEILNAEQEYLNAQVQLVSAQRNAYVAAFSLLAAMGKAEARDLGLDGGVLYDPNVHYKNVRGQIWDWADLPAPTQVATDTRSIPAANADVPATSVTRIP
jgi:outer membrane protein